MKFAFYRASGTVLDKIIRFWERGRYSHVEVVLADLGDGLFTVASSVPWIGVRIANIALPASDWDIVEATGDANAVHAWFATHVGAGYDYRGLFGFVLRRVVGDKSKYFCSEAVATALGMNEPWRFDPNGLADALARPLAQAA